MLCCAGVDEIVSHKPVPDEHQDPEALMMSLSRSSPPETYVVTPHRKRRPGFHNPPAQNPPFVPLSLLCAPPGYPVDDNLLGHHPLAALSALRLQPRHPLSASSPPPLPVPRPPDRYVGPRACALLWSRLRDVIVDNVAGPYHLYMVAART